VKETYYFSHDANARNDEKILMLRAEHGMAGYGIYWALIESMFENDDTRLRHDKVKGLALVLNIEITLLSSVINTCITEKLFESDEVNFWSESLMRRKNKYRDSVKLKSEAGKKGMAKRWGSVENRESDNTVITDGESVITKNNKVKESKVKESKDIKHKYGEFENVSLSESEYQKLIERYGESVIIEFIEKLDNYIASKGTKYKNHYATILNWIKKEPGLNKTISPKRTITIDG